MSEFKVDDIVDVVIKGVRVASLPTPGAKVLGMVIADETGSPFIMPPQAAIIRVAPADWPPRPGDVWTFEKAGEPTGVTWFAHTDQHANVAEREVWLTSAFGGTWRPDFVLGLHSAAHLVHREEQNDAPAESSEQVAEPVETEADVLRSAAEKLLARDRAAFAEMTSCPGGYATTNYADYLLSVLGETEPRTPVLEFAVMMSTTVATALAKVLDEAADRWTEYARETDAASANVQFASVLDLARAILGEQDGGERQ